MPVFTPGPTTRIGASAQRSATPLPLANERRHGGREADAVDRVEVEHAAEQDAELVARPRPLRGQAPVLAETLALVEAEHGLGVADVDSEQHRAIVGVARPGRRAEARIQVSVCSSSGERLADALGEVPLR